MQKIRYFLLKDKDFPDRCYGVLIYDKNVDKFRFIIQQGYDYWEYPPIIDTSWELGEKELNQDLMMRFVRSRIIPHGRANIREIMNSAGIKYYNEFDMLMYTSGRCSHDRMYLDEIDEDTYKKYLKGVNEEYKGGF